MKNSIAYSGHVTHYCLSMLTSLVLMLLLLVPVYASDANKEALNTVSVHQHEKQQDSQHNTQDNHQHNTQHNHQHNHQPISTAPQKVKVGIVLYPGFEMLDVYGPMQMLVYGPNFEVLLISENAGKVPSAQGFESIAQYSFATAPQLDVLLVPGGMGTFEQLDNPKLLQFIRDANQHTRYTSSVCTGSALLAKAGLLDGQRATTNKRFFFLSEQQSPNVTWVPQARWVESGKYFTSAGVTAGIDMALGLLAKYSSTDQAANLASLLEYRWDSNPDNDPFAQYVVSMPKQAQGAGKLLSMIPNTQTVKQAAPKFIQLKFNKAPNVNASSIELVNAQGKAVQLRAKHSMGENDLMVLIDEHLPSGQYSVRWTAVFDREAGANSTEQISGEYRLQVQ